MAGYYIPSVKGGGPIQSIKNLVDNLSDKIDFYIVAADRDLGDDKPFENIKVNEWISVGNAKVFYIDITQLTWKKIADIINSVNYKVMYLNSFFDYKFSIIPILLRKLNKIRVKKIVLAPRGQFSPGALGLKSVKKFFYIKLVKILDLYRNITWHATADIEREDIEVIFGNAENIKVANNLTANYKELKYDKSIKKKKGELKIVFISRIHPKKNLKKAIEFLKGIDDKIEFNIYGPLEDKIYWSECEKVIDVLPENIKVSYIGMVDHDRIMDIFKEHHVFLFPTLGENFGHVISEALIAGCPVIISNQTPWRGLLNSNVGWDIDLNKEDEFVKAIQYCAGLTEEKYYKISRSAFIYGKDASSMNKNLDDYKKLFEV